MGGLAVLHPQDCLNDNLLPLKSRRTPKSNPNFSNSSANLTRSEGRKRSPPAAGVRKTKTPPAPMVTANMAAKNLVMGQVNLTRSEGRKRSQPAAGVRKTKTPPAPMVASNMAAKNLVMGQFKILKRGEPLDEILKDRKAAAGDRKVVSGKKKSDKEKRRSKIENLKMDDFALLSTNRLGPDPEMVPKEMNIADFFFAGSAFVDSPPPSSLPLPGFFSTKSFVADDPTTDLRRMLGLTLE